MQVRTHYILLLGAGFSRNWGGLLASEVIDSLIGSQEIRGDEYLRRVLWDNQKNGGFENALAEVQTSFTRGPARHADPLRRLQDGCVKENESSVLRASRNGVPTTHR